MSSADFEKVAAVIDGYRDKAIELETILTAEPAIDPRSEEGAVGEEKKAAVLKDYLKERGLPDPEEVRAPDDKVPCGYRPSLIYRIKGKNPKGAIWIMAHMDVVPPGDLGKWNSDPYKVVVDGDKIFGRGVEDNQQGLVSSVMAVLALKEAGIEPERDIGLLFVADEETGNELGIGYVLENADPFSKDDLILVPDGGAADGSEVEVAEKSILWSKFTVTGKQCHASMPDTGNNAKRAAAHLIVKLDSLKEIYPKSDDVYVPPASTFEPTKHEANVPSVNIIPGEEIFYMDARIMPEYKLDDVQEKIKTLAGEIAADFKVEINVEFPMRSDAAPPTSTDAPVVSEVSEAVKKVYGVDARPVGIGGGTVAAYIRKKGYPAVVWSRMDETMHGPNEYAKISNILGDAKVFACMMLKG